MSSLNDRRKTFLLGMDEIFTSIVTLNAWGKRSVVPPVYFEMIWEQQVAPPREKNVPIDPLGASDV